MCTKYQNLLESPYFCACMRALGCVRPSRIRSLIKHRNINSASDAFADNLSMLLSSQTAEKLYKTVVILLIYYYSFRQTQGYAIIGVFLVKLCTTCFVYTQVNDSRVSNAVCRQCDRRYTSS